MRPSLTRSNSLFRATACPSSRGARPPHRSHDDATRPHPPSPRRHPSAHQNRTSKALAVDVDDTLDAQRLELAFLLSLVEEPLDLATDMTPKDSRRLRAHAELADPQHPTWQLTVIVARIRPRGSGLDRYVRAGSPTGNRRQAILKLSHSDRVEERSRKQKEGGPDVRCMG